MIRRATPRDFSAVQDLERACFQPYRQASAASLHRSLTSRRQSVWILEDKAGLAAVLVLWHHPHRVRVYDIATRPDLRGLGLGLRLMAHAETLARQEGQHWITLEADPREAGLVPWYKSQGFTIVARLPRYYKNGRAAVRMTKPVQ